MKKQCPCVDGVSGVGVSSGFTSSFITTFWISPVSSTVNFTSSATQVTDTPKTGDNTHMLIWILLAIAGMAGSVSAVWIAKKRK